MNRASPYHAAVIRDQSRSQPPLPPEWWPAISLLAGIVALLAIFGGPPVA
jgi:hypothetical protein